MKTAAFLLALAIVGVAAAIFLLPLPGHHAAALDWVLALEALGGLGFILLGLSNWRNDDE